MEVPGYGGLYPAPLGCRWGTPGCHRLHDPGEMRGETEGEAGTARVYAVRP